jgi:hypothetical protein
MAIDINGPDCDASSLRLTSQAMPLQAFERTMNRSGGIVTGRMPKIVGILAEFLGRTETGNEGW